MHGVDKTPEPRKFVGVELRFSLGAGAGGGEIGFAGLPSPPPRKAAAGQNVAQIERDDDDANGDGGPQQNTREIAHQPGLRHARDRRVGERGLQIERRDDSLGQLNVIGLAGSGSRLREWRRRPSQRQSEAENGPARQTAESACATPFARVAILSVRGFKMPYPDCGDLTKPAVASAPPPFSAHIRSGEKTFCACGRRSGNGFHSSASILDFAPTNVRRTAANEYA